VISGVIRNRYFQNTSIGSKSSREREGRVSKNNATECDVSLLIGGTTICNVLTASGDWLDKASEISKFRFLKTSSLSDLGLGCQIFIFHFLRGVQILSKS
jgi:hypothetical protein